MQDAYNLAWKLAMVVRGQAGPDLLDTYHTERKAVATTVLDQTMRSLRYMSPMIDALGVAPAQTAEQTWARIAELSAAGPVGRARRRELSQAIELQQFHYNCHGTEAGHPYAEGALVTTETAPTPGVNSELHYLASTFPGANVPHAWLERAGVPVSTVDVVGHGRFMLLTGIGGEGWVRAVAVVAERLAVPLDAAVIGHHQEYHDVYGDWARVREVGESGCLLVRPDRRVAWRAHEITADPERDLGEALRKVLRRTG